MKFIIRGATGNVRTVYAIKLKAADIERIMYSEEVFEGACLDFGAEKYVIGMLQAAAYAKITGRNINPKHAPLIFQFRDDERRSVGTMQIRIPLPDPSNLQVGVYVVVAHPIIDRK